MSGFTNKVTFIDDMVEKISQSNTSIYLDKQNEFLFLTQLKSIKTSLLVKPISISFKDDVLISTFPFIDSHKDLSNFKLDEKIVNLVLSGLIDLRTIKINDLKTFNHIEYLMWFVNNISNPIFPITFDIDLFNQLDQLNFVLSHNDLVPGNILFDGKENIKLIDYDFTCYNNEYFDVASFITETLNDNDQLITRFITSAMSMGLISDINLLNLEIKYQDILWSLWANYMFEVTNQNIFKDICSAKYERAINRKPY